MVNLAQETSDLYQQMSISRKIFKSKLRACKNMSEQRRADALATALQTDKSTKLFWQKVKRTKKSSPLPISIDNATGTIDVADHWRSHYESILNSSAQSGLNDNLFVQNAIGNSSSFHNIPNLLCTVDLIHILLYKLPLDSSPGADTITAEHLCYCDPSICLHLSIFFNMCLYHNFVPLGCLDTIIVPIVKNANGNWQDSSNYRPIALTSVISKLLEHFILSRIETFLHTTHNQFGFKAQHSTDMCVFLLKQCVSSYIYKGSPIFSVFLDASKAFDKVSHSLLFKKLINRNVPLCFVRLLCFWYKNQTMRVRWGAEVSRSFNVTNGVRQGSVLSPLLFSVYMDQLSYSLNQIATGCCVGDDCLNHLIYADDICCFSPSIEGLQELIDICSDYVHTHEISFNVKKTVGVVFPSKEIKVYSTPSIFLSGTKIKFSDKVRYLGILINQYLLDDDDIKRQVRMLYSAANKLRSRFIKCSSTIKNMLFRSYCTPLYGCHLWHNYTQYTFNRIRVGYNDAYRILHSIPRFMSANEGLVAAEIPTFQALIRRNVYGFVQRCLKSPNNWIKSLMNSDSFSLSKYYEYYNRTLLV